MKIASTKSKAKYKLTPEILAQKCNVGLKAAKRTLAYTSLHSEESRQSWIL